MSSTAISSAAPNQAEAQGSRNGHVGLVVLTSIATGLALGLLLVLGVFAGGSEGRDCRGYDFMRSPLSRGAMPCKRGRSGVT